MKFNMTATTGNVIFGHCINDTDDYRFFNANGTCYLDFPDNARTYSGSISAGTTYEVEIGNFYVKNMVTGSNITSGGTRTFSEQVGNTLKMWYMAQNNTYSSGKLYYLKIYDGDTLIRDFVPCQLDDTNEIGLYDLVENEFYGNAGTGTFIAGNPVE